MTTPAINSLAMACSARLVTLFLVFALILCGCSDAKLVSSSMAPTIKKGETVTVDYAAYAVGAPKRWDVVAFQPPMFTNQVWLMRVVGLPGESMAFAGAGVTVDGKLLALPSHITNVTYVPVGQFGVSSLFVVPNHCYFVLGDNSTNSNDSRFWGALPRANVLGRVGNK